MPDRWDGRKHTLCNECLFVCVTTMMHEDRDWFENELEEIKRNLDGSSVNLVVGPHRHRQPHGEKKYPVSCTSPSLPSDTVHASSSQQNQNPK